MTKIKKIPKKIIIALALLSMVVISIYFLNLDDSPSYTAPVSEKENANYAPPTEEEKQQAEDHKNQIDNSSNGGSTSQSSSVIMTYLNYENNRVNSAAIVQGVFEDGGTCTLTLSKGGQSVIATSQGLQDVNKTICPPLEIERNRLQTGNWTAVLSYNSNTSKGNSPERTVYVP